MDARPTAQAVILSRRNAAVLVTVLNVKELRKIDPGTRLHVTELQTNNYLTMKKVTEKRSTLLLFYAMSFLI